MIPDCVTPPVVGIAVNDTAMHLGFRLSHVFGVQFCFSSPNWMHESHSNVCTEKNHLKVPYQLHEYKSLMSGPEIIVKSIFDACGLVK